MPPEHGIEVLRGAGIVDAVTDHGPAVILSGTRNIQFVATTRAVLMRPQSARRRIDGCALHISVTIAPDFLETIRRFCVWIVSGNIAIGRDVNDLAEMRVKRLCPRLLGVAITGGDKYRAVVRDSYA